MLVLIAGITGNVGQHAARAGLKHGHKIRGLGRTPSKLDETISAQLESFVSSKNYYDIEALETAVRGADAVICAYGGMPELALEAQLLLFRATERAGIKRYLAACWNYDWRNISLYDEEVYDPYICFHAQVSISSAIKPLHIFTGILSEVFFGAEGQGGFTPKDDGVWDPAPAGDTKARAMDIYGTGNEPWYFTTEADAGAFAIDVVTAPDAEEGGFVTLFSCVHSMRELADIYRKIHPEVAVKLIEKGSVEDLETKATQGKQQSDRSRWWEYHRLFFHLYTIKGVWNLGKADTTRYPNVKRTSMEQFLKDHPDI